MNIGIFSDTHLGFLEGTEREQESFDNCKQAIEIFIKEKVDAILLLGDVFHINVPSQETLFKAFQLFSLTKSQANSNLSILRVKNSKEEKINFSGIPIIAIHGTHEHRARDYRNVLDIFHETGHIVYIHAGYALLDNGKEKLAVHGIGGIPEKHALDAFKAWNPKPVKGARNVLLFHQSFKEFLPFDDPMIATLSLDDMPRDFDLIINGHLHWSNELKLGDKTTFLLTGSTVMTQMKKLEAEKPKGVHFYDTLTGRLSFIPLPVQRKLFYHKIEFKDSTPKQILDELAKAIETDLKQKLELKPMLRLKLHGTLAKGYTNADVDLSEIERKYGEKTIMSLEKNFETISFKKKIEELRHLQQSKKSISAIGLDILEKNLDEASFKREFDARRLFEVLTTEKELDKAMAIVLESKGQVAETKQASVTVEKKKTSLAEFA